MKSIYRDIEWGILQQEKEEGEAVTYTAYSDIGSVEYTFIKRKAGVIDDVQYYDLVTPRGQGGPFIIANNQNERRALAELFDKEFHAYCLQNCIAAEYIRFDPWIKNYKDFEHIYDLRPHGQVFCNDLTIDFFHDEYKDTKRRAVRKAEKKGIIIEFDVCHESIGSFLDLYTYTETKYAVSNYYKLTYDFIKRYCDMMPEKIVFVNAVYEGQIISSAILLLGEDIVHYHFAANNPRYSSLQANCLLIYKASLFAAERGNKLFDLGDAIPGSNLERFKRDFVLHGNDYPILVGTKVRNPLIYKRLVEQSGVIEQIYFPAYRSFK